MKDIIKIADIKSAPWNPRKSITDDSVRELAVSIKEWGIVNAIILWESPDKDIFVIAGHRRLAAAKLAGMTELNADEGDYKQFTGDEQDARELTILDNLQREGVSVIEEAEVVRQMLDAGKTVYYISARLGKSCGWVARRKKVATIAQPWKDRAEKCEIDADALERIASFPQDVQERTAKKVPESYTHWREISSYFAQEQKRLDTAKFDTSACHECVTRTGSECDLFGVTDGDLGCCMCAKCFNKKCKEAESAAIEKTCGDAEIVRVKYVWEAPSDSVEERDKTHPCAYVLSLGDGSVEVRWGESKAAKDAAKKAEEERREAEREASRADNERANAISQKLEEYFSTDDDGTCKPLVDGTICSLLNTNAYGEAVLDWAHNALLNELSSWKGDAEWAEIAHAFPACATAAGVSEEDVKWFYERNKTND